MNTITSILGRIIRSNKLASCRFIILFLWTLALIPQAHSLPLMEEGFNYAAGTGLAANPPWAGSIGPSVGLISGNLSITNLRSTVPVGNMLQIMGGTSQTVYRNFSSSAITGGAVYFSALVRCVQLPTNSQFIASLMDTGNTSPNLDTDPLGLYVSPAPNGYTFSVVTAGSDPAKVRQTLAANTTHLIVMKYVFGSSGQASIYVDPTPGGGEPNSPSAITDPGDIGTGAGNLQIVLFSSSSSSAQGNYNFDTLRVGTNWADVTPKPAPLTLTGPLDRAVCFGSGASFSVLASGTPPYTYLWRTNGIAVPAATNSIFLLNNPGGNDALNNFDVVVNDAFGSTTSRVAKLTFTTNAAAIFAPPASQLVLPGVSNATFSVTAAGDAPLSIQWRTNGVAVSGATNVTFTVNNPGLTDVTNAIDIVVSNPCGSVTSSPPVGVIFPTLFCVAYDAGAGFFSGENLIMTNASGMSPYVWSSSNPSISVTNWTMEGMMSELPLGTTGQSRYGINLNPTTSPVYYIFAHTNSGPFTSTEPVIWLTTPDFASFAVTNSEIAISAGGILNFPVPPIIIQSPQSQTVLAGQSASFSVAASGPGLNYQWSLNNNSITNAPAPVLNLTNVSAAAAGSYAVIVSNSLGSATSSIATLTVTLPPSLRLNTGLAGIIQLNANSITGLTYVVESATNLSHPIWKPILTNNTGNGGVVNFQTNAVNAPSQFYRLVFP